MASYRLKSPIMAVEHSGSGMHITQVPAGAIVRLPDALQEAGLIEIVHEGRSISVFVQDVRERGERISTKVA